MIIIGGGIMGMSIAYHLQQHTNTIVYDRQDEGQATKASAGIICPWVSQRRNKLWLEMVTKSAAYYPKFIEKLSKESNIDPAFKQNGAYILFDDDKKYRKALKRIKNNNEIYREMISVSENKDVTDLNNEYYNIFVEGGGQVKGESLLEALKDAYLKSGGTIKYEEYKGKDDDFKIYATGAYGREQSFEPKVSHQKAEILHVKTNGDYENLPVVMHRSHYIVNLNKNHFAVGTTHIDTESFDVTPTKENMEYLLNVFHEFYPQIEIVDQFMKVGLRPYTRDFLPFLGYIDEKTFVANGLGSSGLTAAPFLGKVISDTLLFNDAELDIEKYSYL